MKEFCPSLSKPASGRDRASEEQRQTAGLGLAVRRTNSCSGASCTHASTVLLYIRAGVGLHCGQEPQRTR